MHKIIAWAHAFSAGGYPGRAAAHAAVPATVVSPTWAEVAIIPTVFILVGLLQRERGPEEGWLHGTLCYVL